LSPALLPRERRAIVPALYLGVILFAAGVMLAYFVAVPFTLKFTMSLLDDSLAPQITAGLYFSFVLKLLLGFGVLFEMPVVVLILTSIGLVTSKFLRSKRRYAIAVMAVAAALITPGDAITATLVLMGPLLLLYELSIGLARLVERNRERSTEAEAISEATL
jgi:sec-independent protein translocase protein TatC